MTKKLTTIYSLIAAAAAGLGLWSCSADNLGVSEPDNGPALGETVRLTVAVSRDPSTATRTALTENAGRLDCVWSADDKLLVTDASGNVAGLLSLKEGQEFGKTAVFDGDVNITSENGKAWVNFLYLGTEWSKTATKENPGVTGNSITIDYSGEQPGTIEGLTAKDLLVKKGEEVTISGNKAYLAKTIAMDRLISFGKFKMKGVEATDAYTVSITGSNLHNKVVLDLASMAPEYSKEENTGLNVKADKDGVFYTVLLPTSNDDAAEKKLETLTFAAKVGEKDYNRTFTSNKEEGIKRSRFYRSHTAASGDTPESFGPIEITEDAGNNDPIVDDEVVGPAFQIDVFDESGNKVTKWVKFTRANLHYKTAGNGEWYIPEEQTMYKNRSGKRVGNNTTSNPEIIDLFRWGATGYNDVTYAPRPADFWKVNVYDKNGSYGTIDLYFPSSKQANSTISSSSFTRSGNAQGTPYDWGVAYSNQKDDGSEYYTLTSEQWGVITHYCTALGIVDDVKGAIMFPCLTASEAETLVSKAGGSTSSLKKIDKTDNRFNKTDYDFTRITLTYAQLTQIGAVFFPCAGKATADGVDNSGNTDETNTSWGYGNASYWTSTALSQRNSSVWFFRSEGSKSGPSKDFQIYGQGRGQGNSVRLVKVVPAPTNSGNN